ncbi:LOW QUALITY PROTEIN: 3 beta-hydroxysteroid dehydrogenase type 7-like [Vidua chalybeata]|uniref:LOW QUALITY PROTEIN: 3 beta-hydroxysteroid dehydrogenase type 7-like n=1 Tax=Vidua chalybeata TaxID=81927 RepID=UPI0023A83E7D|nr:LOW QUALITY PROTEIN: 3 beta-hydroxysteroid dehydrogenase type 7-like [Vidua chalybeata]
MDGARVYLVTGGCGFVGERIVELLSQQDYIKEVRGFDSAAREEVEKLSTGTENVVRACCVLNIPHLLYTSPITAMGPSTSCEPLLRGNEDTQYGGEVELPYGKTKAMAEKIVLEANGTKLSNGGTLRTCILCANTVYGEKAAFLQELYVLARARNGVLSYLEPEDTERNHTYVGNVAWMHVLAARHLQLKADLLAEQVHYCFGDTPSRKGFLVRHQLLSSADPSVRLGSHIPYWKMWLMIQLHRIIRVILSPFWRPQPFLNVPLLNTIVTTFSFETDKASRHFGYKPLFTWQESRLRTAQWLKAAAGSLGPPPAA